MSEKWAFENWIIPISNGHCTCKSVMVNALIKMFGKNFLKLGLEVPRRLQWGFEN
jgi:hypothetical protein